MTYALIEDRLAELKDALVEERRMLLSGQAKDTVALLGGKLQAMEDLQNAFGSLEPDAVPPAYRDEVAGIAQLARENAIHFEAVRNGMRRAIQRLESMHASAYVGSYTQYGGKMAFPEVTGGFLKKA